MTRSDKDTIFILSRRSGYIPHLSLYGPIVHPIKCPRPLCLSMLTAGVDLHEYDPETKLTIQLTINNLYDEKKFDAINPKEKPKVKAKEIEPKPVVGVEVKPVEPVKAPEPVVVEETKEPEKVIAGVKVESKEEDEKKEPVEEPTMFMVDDSKEKEKESPQNNYKKNNKKK